MSNFVDDQVNVNVNTVLFASQIQGKEPDMAVNFTRALFF